MDSRTEAMKRERDAFRSGVMGAAHSVVDNLRDLINDDMFGVSEIREECDFLIALVTIGRTVTGDDPYDVFVNVMDHVDPLPSDDA